MDKTVYEALKSLKTQPDMQKFLEYLGEMLLRAKDEIITESEVENIYRLQGRANAISELIKTIENADSILEALDNVETSGFTGTHEQ